MTDTTAKPVKIDTDLTETALFEAIKEVRPEWSKEELTLIASVADGVTAGRLANEYNIRNVILLPEKIWPPDAWVLSGSYAVYSEGA